MKLGGERLGAQESVSKCLQVEISRQPGLRGVRAFYSPPRESSRWGVRDLDMSRSGAGHVRPTYLEPGLGIRYVWSGDMVTEELG
jgi:hypothetical protein